MTETTTSKRRLGKTLLAASIIATAGGAVGSMYDAILLAGLAVGAGLIWSDPRWKRVALAVPIALGGIVWSSLDTDGCSAGSKIRIFYEKLIGHLPYVGWEHLKEKAFSRACFSSFKEADLDKVIQKIGEETVNGRRRELYKTSLGNFWIPAPGDDLMRWLIWELTFQHDYENGDLVIRPGDTVIDCGAHIGTYTRYALNQGAGKVVAIEPEPTNIAMLEANFGPEIASGRVILVKAGVWDEKSELTLSDSDDNSARHSFVIHVPNSTKMTHMPVLPLDDIVAQYNLERVDFIKMDIEGAERRALAGARQTITRFHPKMAICTYHQPDDPVAIAAVVRTITSRYGIQAKDFHTFVSYYTTKVFFFHPV